MLKLTTKLLIKETHGRFKLNGDERSKTGRNEKKGVYREVDALDVQCTVNF